jgi:uncharacterized membrane protein
MSTNDAMAKGAVAADEGLTLVLPGKGVAAGQGVTWIGTGWKLFAKAPLMWIVALLVLVVIAIVVNLVPILGGIAFQILTPVFYGGFFVACRSLERGGDFELEHVFAGFKTQFANLAIVGAIFLVAMLALLVVLAVFVGFGILGALLSGNPDDVLPAIAASGAAILLGLLVMLALMIPVLMAYWFAPALVIMHGMNAFEAMKASFFGCLKNLLPFLVYGVVMLIIFVVASIPLGLGLLVAIPLSFTSTYAAYRDIFTEDAAAASVVTTTI